MPRPPVPEWFHHAVAYEIYPQSFYDANGDGIGDLPGIIEKLDYIESLGVNTLWLNPCYDSPFLDAGYDVRNHYRIAERYGTNADLKRLVRKAKQRGIRILMDLVVGHTSIDHPWFLASCAHERNEHTDSFIWTRDWWEGMGQPKYINGHAERAGAFRTSFFYHQPSLNYGFSDPEHPWEMHYSDPRCRKVWDEVKNIMRFWLDMGVAGFRVDTAKAIVVGNPLKGTTAFWRWIRAFMDQEYPEAVIVTEWGWPIDALRAGHHSSFVLHNQKAYKALFKHHSWPTPYGGIGFFDKKTTGPREFVDAYLYHYHAVARLGHIALPTSNHDCRRVASGRSAREMELVFALLLTMPGVPFTYYGEEIGMQYVPDLPSKEGGYPRTGSRTPMQWDNTPNAGFSTCKPKDLYLPIDPDPHRPTVAAQDADPRSLLNAFRALSRLRANTPALGACGAFKVLFAEENQTPLVYLRSEGTQRVLVALNPSGKRATARVTLPRRCGNPVKRAGHGAKLSVDVRVATIDFGAVSYGIWEV